jgi:transposase
VKELPLKKEPYYIERDEEKRREFDEQIAEITPDIDIAYVDESGIKRNMPREYGRAPAGQRVYLPTGGTRPKKVNVVAGLCNGKVICPTKYAWNTNAEWFNEWFEWWFCPLLRVGSVIVMDNAGFHKKKELNRIALSYGCRIIWLPPYSPDKNPIEKVWANLKNWLRLNSKNYSTIQDAISDYFQSY